MPGLLRAAGWSITTLAEHYGIPDDERVDDVTWLLLAGGEGWAVLMKETGSGIARLSARPLSIQESQRSASRVAT